MFCYVKFVGEKDFIIVQSDRIHHFQPPVNKTKLYKIRCGDKYRDAAIAFVEETRDDLRIRIDKERAKVVPSALLLSASEITDDEEKLQKQATLSIKSSILEKKLLAMSATMQIELMKDYQMSLMGEEIMRLILWSMRHPNRDHVLLRTLLHLIYQNDTMTKKNDSDTGSIEENEKNEQSELGRRYDGDDGNRKVKRAVRDDEGEKNEKNKRSKRDEEGEGVERVETDKGDKRDEKDEGGSGEEVDQGDKRYEGEKTNKIEVTNPGKSHSKTKKKQEKKGPKNERRKRKESTEQNLAESQASDRERSTPPIAKIDPPDAQSNSPILTLVAIPDYLNGTEVFEAIEAHASSDILELRPSVPTELAPRTTDVTIVESEQSAVCTLAEAPSEVPHTVAVKGTPANVNGERQDYPRSLPPTKYGPGTSGGIASSGRILDSSSVGEKSEVTRIPKRKEVSKKSSRKKSGKEKSKKSRKKNHDEGSRLCCCKDLREDVKKLVKDAKESSEARTAFEERVIRSLTILEDNWRQLQSARTATGGVANEAQPEDMTKPPEPGFIRMIADEEKIHCGHNVWVPTLAYRSNVYSARSDALFVKSMAVTIFGREVLQNSSVTGASSNRTKNKAKPALDATKALAVRDIYRYFLETHRRYSPEKVDGIVADYLNCIRGKISDLCKPPGPRTSKGRTYVGAKGNEEADQKKRKSLDRSEKEEAAITVENGESAEKEEVAITVENGEPTASCSSSCSSTSSSSSSEDD